VSVGGAEAEWRRIVLDTNVLVSALLTPTGNPNTILRTVLDGELTVVYSAAIMTEYHSVLARPRFGFDARDIMDLTSFIETCGEVTSPIPSTVHLPDESDRPFYDTAKDARAILITGNSRHYPLLDGLMTPAEYVRLFIN